ncbi:MAG: hypothetical protein M0R80_03980 [Proteobacteria bacterium]|jgi:hypothetical protein|nr:hypothetical protein [Pseudomonadota bacterium]
MQIKDSFLLDPVGELLYFEEEFSVPNRHPNDRVRLISQYSRLFIDLPEVAKTLPSQYLLHLLNGLEASIKDDILRRKKEYSLEIKKRKNKSLGNYEQSL